MRRSPTRPEHRRLPRPTPAVRHRAVRVTLAACTGFYTFRYGFDQPVTATYALFGAIALGVLAQIGGGSRVRARTLLMTLPFAWALVCLGTALAVHAWAAALGMVGVGFTVSFASVGGPRLVGLANGLQLFYILPCFPPFAPDTLPQRLVGATAGILLLAAADRLLWPEPPPVDYRERLALAAEAVADLADIAATDCSAAAAGRARGAAPDRTADVREHADALLDDLRFSRIPVMERPASANAVDRALSHCAITLHYTCMQLLRIRRAVAVGGPYPQAAELVGATARALRAAGAGVRSTGPVPTAGPIEEQIAAFETARTAGPGGTTGVTEVAGVAGVAGVAEPDGHPGAVDGAGRGTVGTAVVARLGVGTLSLDAAEGTRFFTLAARVSRCAPLPPDQTPPDQRPGPFWYAHEPTALLWWHRFQGNLTLRSVYFRNALRTAAALGAARLVAGALDLSHGFWVLLATLTLMRTSAADTRMTLRPALVGTATGAGVTALMLVAVGDHPVFYAAALPPVMLFAFTVSPGLGLAWAQGTFTVVIAMVFTQLAPAGWQLAEARVVNVATGAAIGILAGICAWPRGGGQDLRRRTAELLAESADALRETVEVVTGAGPPRGALHRARRSALLTEAMYAQYRCERHGSTGDGPNWQAAVLVGQHTVRGAEPLLARIPPGSAVAGPKTAASLVRDANGVAEAFRRQGAALLDGSPSGPADPQLGDARSALIDERLMATRLPADRASLHTVDVVVWLGGLLDDLERVAGRARPPGEPARAAPG
ncbi:FUSC family protein [Kitasatospora sp. NPDC059571]|uniref:FUSC family protein n=1 Tax=Kitasatospora sp. NPDC059571 TaxID=3346871 RepID=UPI0036A43124